MGLRGAAGSFDVCERGVRPAVRDVVADRAREQDRVLHDHADRRAQGCERHPTDVVAVDEYRALARVVEARDQVHE